MEVNWRAVGAGFVTAVVIGLLSGVTIPFVGVTLPVIGYGLAGLVGGFVAGYMATSVTENGMIHGGLATVIGGIVVLMILSLLTVFASPVAGVSVFVAGMIVLLLQAVPGAVGGAIGSYVNRRREPADVEVGKPAA